MPGGDFHPSDQAHSRAHDRRRSGGPKGDSIRLTFKQPGRRDGGGPSAPPVPCPLEMC
jgi:hypothetical protein